MNDARESLSQTHRSPRRPSHEPCREVLELRAEHDAYVERTDERLADGSEAMRGLAVDVRGLRRDLSETSGLLREVLSAVNSQRSIHSEAAPELKGPGGFGLKGPPWVILTISIFGIMFLGMLASAVYFTIERIRAQTVLLAPTTQTAGGK